MTPTELTQERGKTHGPWDIQAACADALKHVIQQDVERWKWMIPSQREALDMIAVKISRILTGDPNCVDHWADIAGYATLVANELSGQLSGVTTSAMQGVKIMYHHSASVDGNIIRNSKGVGLKDKVRCVIAPNGLDITVGNTYDIAKGHADPNWIFIYNDLNKVGSYKADYFVAA